MRRKASAYQTASIHDIIHKALSGSQPTTRKFIANGIIQCHWILEDRYRFPLPIITASITKLGHIIHGSGDPYNVWLRIRVGPYPESERITLSTGVLDANEGIVRRLLADFRKHPLVGKKVDTSMLPILGDALEDAGVNHNLLLSLCHSSSLSALYIIRNE